MIMEEVCARENMMNAYLRVVRNGGAPGVDGMTVDELMPYCREHWSRIRWMLIGDMYRPRPVKRVDIPKPTGRGMRQLGIEKVRPIITRGILIDVAGFKNVDRLSKGYEVTVEDVRGALKRQGIREESIREGDALLFRYGWSSLWSEPDRYNDSPAGIGLEVARWVVAREATMIGSDQVSPPS